MISSNGGSWSNSISAANNVVKAFKFIKGDTIIIDYDPKEMCIVFTKEQSQENYKLEIKFIEGDQLHPCILFYYLNDEVEFVNNYKH